MKERIAERVEGLIVGHKRDGRSIYSNAGKRALIYACLQPGMAFSNRPGGDAIAEWTLTPSTVVTVFPRKLLLIAHGCIFVFFLSFRDVQEMMLERVC